MKVEKKSVEGFVPFELVITIENKAEASALYNIFNHTHNTNLLPDLGCSLRDAIGAHNQFTDCKNKTIANKVSYSNYYKY